MLPTPDLHRSLATQTSGRKAKVKSVVRASAGNFLEMYDFMVYGYYASAIGQAFFPKSNPYASLMVSLLTFGVGFLMRPLGALVLGPYIDRKGRRAGLVLALTLMSIGTLSIACTPRYATIGLIAPTIIVLGRLLQGFSAGVELGGVSVYLSEIATPGHKGLYVSWQSASQQCAVVFAALLGVLLHMLLLDDQMSSFGWRVPMLVGCAIIPMLFLLRRSMEETEEFLAQQKRPTSREVFHSLADNWRIILLGTMLVMMTTVSFYLITAFTPTFGTSILRLSEMQTLTVTLFIGISNFIWLPISGALSDRIGRTPILGTSCVLALCTSYPALLLLVAAPSFPRLLMVELWLSFLYGSYNGAMVAYLTEIMPRRIRATGFSLCYSLATAVFGGFTPAVCTYLIHLTHNQAVPGLWLSLAALIGLTAVIALRRVETANPNGLT